MTSSVATPLLNDKSKRGWNHNTTATALCPLKLCTQFLHDPMYAPYSQMPMFDQLTVYRAFHNSIQSGTLRIKTGNYPCFLYPNNTAYNSKDRAKGLFRGPVFIRVHFRCLSVTFPDTSSSKDSPICLHGPFICFHWSPTATCALNSEIHGMKKVTPEMIVYISVQVSIPTSLIIQTSCLHPRP